MTKSREPGCIRIIKASSLGNASPARQTRRQNAPGAMRNPRATTRAFAWFPLSCSGHSAPSICSTRIATQVTGASLAAQAWKLLRIASNPTGNERHSDGAARARTSPTSDVPLAAVPRGRDFVPLSGCESVRPRAQSRRGALNVVVAILLARASNDSGD